MQIEIIRETNGFKDLEKDWNLLLADSGQDNLFLTFDWLFTWWQYFKDNYSLLIILVKEDGKIIGIAPLMISKRFGFRELRFISSGMSDYEDIITSGNDVKRKEILDTIINKIKESEGWDIFRLNRLREDSPNFSLFHKISQVSNSAKINLRQHKEGAAYIAIEKSWSEYCSGLKKKLIADTRRQLSRLSKGDDNFLSRNVEDENEISMLLDKLIEFYRSRRKFKKDKCIFDIPLLAEFIKSVSRKFFSKGWLDLSFLEADNAIAAIHLGFIHKNRFYYFMPAHNIDFNQYSPGRLLLYDLVRKGFNNHLRQFDFMIGEEDYKFDWSTDIEKLYFASMYYPTFKGYLANQVFNRINLAIKKLSGKQW